GIVDVLEGPQGIALALLEGAPGAPFYERPGDLLDAFLRLRSAFEQRRRDRQLSGHVAELAARERIEVGAGARPLAGHEGARHAVGAALARLEGEHDLVDLKGLEGELLPRGVAGDVAQVELGHAGGFARVAQGIREVAVL